jgi:hypothetical protein
MSRSITSSLHAIYQKLIRTHSHRIHQHHRRKRKARLSLETNGVDDNLWRVTLEGQIFHDANDNSIQEATEDGLAGWTVWVDTNNNGQQNVGEPGAVTDVKGKVSHRRNSSRQLQCHRTPRTGLHSINRPQRSTTRSDSRRQNGQSRLPQHHSARSPPVPLSGTSVR